MPTPAPRDADHENPDLKDKLNEDDVVLSPEEALQVATGLHQQGAFEQAEYIYQKLLKLDPKNAGALQFLGVLRHGQGRNAEAVELIEEAHGIVGDEPGLLMNYGNILLEAGRGHDAVDIYQRMLTQMPNNAGAWNNMGVLLRTLGRTDLAEEAFQKSIALDEDNAGPWHNLGNLYLSTGRIEDSVKAALRSITLLPESKVGRKLLGVAYSYLGEIDKAKAVFTKWLEDEPGDPTAEHHLAALEGRIPERASDAYVENVFDSFAVSFDARLEGLEYRAPEIVRAALAERVSEDAPVKMLDVGCGTGLCGPLVRPLASRLVGIDLSGKMLEKAHTRNSYDELTKAEFIAYLEAVEERFGAIIAADALCYVGQMEDFSRNALAALEPGGVLIATFEADPDAKDITLTPTGRYTHGKDYLERTFGEAGFAGITCTNDRLRYEQGNPVEGWVLVAERPR